MNKDKCIGRTIKELRQSNEWTQLKLGSKFSQPKDGSLISRWERGRVIPSTESIAKLSNIFNVQTDDLLRSVHRQTSQSI